MDQETGLISKGPPKAQVREIRVKKYRKGEDEPYDEIVIAKVINDGTE